MLPLWSDQLQIVLTPEHVTLTRQSSGLSSGQSVSNTMPCAALTQGELAWQPALRAMQTLLKQKKIKKAKASVLLSNHFVRYQLINKQPDLSSYDEEQGFVRFSFAEVYGDEVNRWQIRWGSGLQLAPQVASAIDNALIEQIETSLGQAGVKLNSLQPYLMAAFNYVRKWVDASPHWFVLVEPGNACAGFMQGGDWRQLHTSRLGADWAAELPRVLEREFQMVGPIGERSQMIVCLPSYVDPKRVAPGNSLRVLTMTPEMLMQNAVKSIKVQSASAQSVTAQPTVVMGVK